MRPFSLPLPVRSYWSDWGRFCQRVWMCREDKLFKVSAGAAAEATIL